MQMLNRLVGADLQRNEQSELEANTGNRRKARENTCELCASNASDDLFSFRFPLGEKAARVLLTNHSAY